VLGSRFAVLASYGIVLSVGCQPRKGGDLGNLANRMLSFAYKRFEGKVPEPGDPSGASGQGLDDADRALLAQIEAGFETVGKLYAACKFRAALGEAFALAREANGYLARRAPWFQIKEHRQAAATMVYVILRAVDNLKTILAPSGWSSTRRKRAATRR
jgi:methionyl-tRNA synthetase